MAAIPGDENSFGDETNTEAANPMALESAALDFILDESQEQFEIRFFESVLSRSKDNVDVLRQLVDLMANRGNYQRSLELDLRLVDLRPKDCFAKYNLACSLSVLGRIIPALKALDEALRLGYDDFVHMDADSDLDAVRQHPEYFHMLERHGLAG